MKATYIKTRLPSVVTVSRIVTIHDYEVDCNFSFDGERHDFWEMVFVDKGSVEICRDSETLTLSEGEVIMHSPNEFHSVKAFNSSPRFFVISFVCSSPAMNGLVHYQTLLGKTLRPYLTSILNEAKRTFVIPKNDLDLKVLERKGDAVIGGEQLIKTYLEQLLIFMIRDAAQMGDYRLFPSKESMETHIVESVKAIIEDNVDKPFRVEDICRRMGYSRSYLSRLFRKETGDTLAHFALSVRIKAAKQLIGDGGMNFAEISDRLSFDNPQYFSRTFKRITGMTPTEFKLTLNS